MDDDVLVADLVDECDQESEPSSSSTLPLLESDEDELHDQSYRGST